MKRVMALAGLVAGLAVLTVAVVALIRIGPRNLWGMLRYDQRREGDLVVGDRAPDLVLTALDGVTRVRLHELIEKRPLVLIFGSYT